MTVTKEHVALARKELREDRCNAACCCIIYQMCKQAGLPIAVCGLTHIWLIGRPEIEIRLPLSAQDVTFLTIDDWNNAVGLEVDLPELPIN